MNGLFVKLKVAWSSGEIKHPGAYFNLCDYLKKCLPSMKCCDKYGNYRQGRDCPVLTMHLGRAQPDSMNRISYMIDLMPSTSIVIVLLVLAGFVTLAIS